jgi:CheY-like chemotaxis protein
MNPDGIEPLFNKLLIVASGPEARSLLVKTCQEFGCQVLLADNNQFATEIVQNEPDIDVILYEVASGDKVIACFDFVRFVRMTHAELPPIFVLCDENDSGLGNVFYEGVTGIFMRPLNVGDLTKAIAISYSELLGHRDRLLKRRRLQYATVSYSIDAGPVIGFATDISLGGMFIGSHWELPAEGKLIKFKLNIVGHSALSGGAVVKWTRDKIEFGRPRGFGIEFRCVDQATLASIMREPWRNEEDEKWNANDIWTPTVPVNSFRS